jgi:hypothetical protein
MDSHVKEIRVDDLPVLFGSWFPTEPWGLVLTLFCFSWNILFHSEKVLHFRETFNSDVFLKDVKSGRDYNPV